MTAYTKDTKPWRTPAWFMLSIVMFNLATQVLLFRLLPGGQHYSSMSRTTQVLMALWPVFLLAEAFVYWLFRKRWWNRKYVWMHIGLTLFSFVLLRMVFVILTGAIAYYFNLSSNNIIRLVGQLQFFSFWISLVVGQAFFVVALVVNLRKRQPELPGDENDLLNEYAQ